MPVLLVIPSPLFLYLLQLEDELLIFILILDPIPPISPAAGFSDVRPQMKGAARFKLTAPTRPEGETASDPERPFVTRPASFFLPSSSFFLASHIFCLSEETNHTSPPSSECGQMSNIFDLGKYQLVSMYSQPTATAPHLRPNSASSAFRCCSALGSTKMNLTVVEMND